MLLRSINWNGDVHRNILDPSAERREKARSKRSQGKSPVPDKPYPARPPYKYPPEYEYLKGDMKGLISRRINKQHRLVYEVMEEDKVIKIYRMWTHYE